MKHLFLAVLCAALIVTSFSVAVAQDNTIAEIVTMQAADDVPEFTTLLAAVQAADPSVLEALNDPEQELTVLAPTDDAFDRLRRDMGNDEFDALLADTERLTNVLLYHVMPGVINGPDLPDATSTSAYAGSQSFLLPTLQGQRLDVLVDTWYGVEIDGDAAVVQFDIEATNGVIHVIDRVLLPEERLIGEALVQRATEGRGRLFRSSEFTDLLTAMETAPPVFLETLNDPNAEVTIFAPTDAAFDDLRDAIGAEAYETLTADPAAIASVLLNHSLMGSNYTQGEGQPIARALASGEEVVIDTLLPNSSFTVGIGSEGGLVLNDDVRIVARDIDFANGVVHVIDGVLVPSEDTMFTSETIVAEVLITVVTPPGQGE